MITKVNADFSKKIVVQSNEYNKLVTIQFAEYYSQFFTKIQKIALYMPHAEFIIQTVPK